MGGEMSKSNEGIVRLLEVVRKLRGKDGCPWDREQTLDSLKKYLVEECYELIDAIDGQRVDEHLDELGDVLLQVALQAQIRDEEGAFCFDDVANHLADKLIRRHPHVFGKVKVKDSAEVVRNWAAIKSGEKGGARAIDEGIPRGLPPLHRAQKIQDRAARVGFDWDCIEDVEEKVREELAEVREARRGDDASLLKEELGDLLFSVVNLCRFAKIDATSALGGATAKFVRRFKEVQRRVDASGRTIGDCSLKELDEVWEEVKRM